MYLNGRGVARDDAEAVRWIRPAADQGYAPAQRYLGMLYRDGRAVAPDPGEATRWYRLAAEQGEPLAQYDLGAMYGDGSGGRQDDASAYVWLSLAASRLIGDERERAARLRDEIGRRMSEGQRADAARRARDWKPVSGVELGRRQREAVEDEQAAPVGVERSQRRAELALVQRRQIERPGLRLRHPRRPHPPGGVGPAVAVADHDEPPGRGGGRLRKGVQHATGPPGPECGEAAEPKKTSPRDHRVPPGASAVEPVRKRSLPAMETSRSSI